MKHCVNFFNFENLILYLMIQFGELGYYFYFNLKFQNYQVHSQFA